MVMLYSILIIKEKKKFSEIPNHMKEKVRQMLIDLEVGYLADENPNDGE